MKYVGEVFYFGNTFDTYKGIVLGVIGEVCKCIKRSTKKYQ